MPPDEHENGHGRRDVDDLLAASLASGMTYDQAAASAGCSRATVTRRMSSEKFRARVDEERAELVNRLKNRVSDAATRAVDVLDSLAANARSESVRVTAAGKLLDLALTRRHL